MPERYEQLLFRYSSALERGDFEAVADVLREAERDPALEAMLLELNEVYAAEQTGRFNHKNPKELAMIAPVYEKRAPERVRTYNLPMVAALAVVALLSVLLATRIAPPTQWNTAQNGSPEPNVVQGVPDECAPSEADPGRIQLYARPSKESRYAYDAFSTLYISQNNLSQLDAVEAEGETWYFVRISGVFREDMQGWMTAEEYNRNIRCAPLVNPTIIAQVTESAVMTGTPTPAPFEENFDVTVTAIAAQGTALQATALLPTVVPPDMLAVVTATPMPFDGNVPTVVPANVPIEMLRCTKEALVSLDVHTEPSDESLIIGTLPVGATFESFQRVTQDDGVRWTQVQGEVQGVTIGGGWVILESGDARSIECWVSVYMTATPMPNTGDALFLPTLVPADVRGIGTFTPTPVPFDGSAPTVVPAVPTVTPVSFPEDYIVYTVEAGDTLLSILAHFNFDASMLDELLFINNLPTDVAELPETLLIPVQTGERWLTCLVDMGETIVVRQQPASDAREIATLPEGTVFRVFNNMEQANREWYMVVAQFGSAVIRSVWMDTEALSMNADCQRFFPTPLAVLTMSAEQLVTTEAQMQTATPVPGSVIILPPTVVSPSSIQTQDAILSTSQPSCTGVNNDVLSIYAGPERVGRVIFEVPAGSVLDVRAYYDQPDGRWHVVGYWAAAGVYITGLTEPDTLTLSEACADMLSVVTYTPTPMPSLPPRLTATPTPAR